MLYIFIKTTRHEHVKELQEFYHLILVYNSSVQHSFNIPGETT